MGSRKTIFCAQAAMIAAIYVALTYVFQVISFGPVQIRMAEMLVILPYFTPAAIPGLFIGCLLANLLGGAVVLDIVFGSIATLIGAVLSYLLRRNKYLVPIPPILANTMIIPFVLKFGYGLDLPVWSMMLTVGGGEILSCGVLGMLLLLALSRYERLSKHVIFKSDRA